MYCVKCGKLLDNDDRFCPNCGKTNPDFLYCMKCGKPLDSNTRFCSGCGTQNPNFDYDPYTPGINPPPAGYNSDAGYPGDPGYPGNAGYAGGSGYANASGYTAASAQTVSPYADDLMPNGQANAAQNNIPPVYSPESQNAVGFANSGTPVQPAPDMNGINGKKAGKNNKAAIIGISAATIMAIVGLTVGGAWITRHTENSDRMDASYTDEYELKEYDFNPLNNIKEPEVIWETDSVKISTRNIIHDYPTSSNAKLQLQVENKTDDKLIVRTDKVLINGCDLESSFYSSLDAGNINTSDVYIDLDKMAEMNIENINSIDLWFETENSNYTKVETSDRITVETKNTKTNDIYKGPENMLYNKDGIKIGYFGKEYTSRYNDSIYIRFYYENDKDINVDFDIDSLKINGKEASPYDHAVVYSGSRGIYDVYIYGSKLDKLKIKDIDDIRDIVVSITGTEQGSREVIFETGDLYTSVDR
ncbi:MAG: zinc ribbon domain-containing protein [Oscillospiraceae bacterium]|nr:zinc ribbon domain-containing protein [Oscillospiraceae bacterium]